MDIFSGIWHGYQRAASAIPDPLFDFLLNAVAGLLLPTLLGFVGFMQGWRGPVFQWLAFVAGFLVAIALPLEAFFGAEFLRVWLLPFLLLGAIYLPHAWAFLIEPRRAQQRSIRLRIQLVLLGLFFLNLCWMGLS